jgi:hypothetical protein
MPTQVQLNTPDWLRPFGQGVEDLSGPERRDVRRRMHTETPVVSEMPLSPGSLMAIAGMMPALFGGAKYLPQAGAVVRRIPETLRNAMRTGDSVAVAKTPGVGRIGAAQKTRREALTSFFPLPKVVDIGRGGLELGNANPAEIDAYRAALPKLRAEEGEVGTPSENQEAIWDIYEDIAQRQREAWLAVEDAAPGGPAWEGSGEGSREELWKSFQDVKRRIGNYPVGRSTILDLDQDGYLDTSNPDDQLPPRTNTIKAYVETGAQLIGEEFIQALAAEASEKLGRHVSEEEIRQQIDEASGIEGTYDKVKSALARRFGRYGR